MVQVPKKNISSRIADIKSSETEEVQPAAVSQAPTQDIDPSVAEFVLGQGGQPPQEEKTVLPPLVGRGRKILRTSLLTIAISTVVIVATFIFIGYNARSQIKSALTTSMGDLRSAIADLEAFDFKNAGDKIASGSARIAQTTQSINDLTGAIRPLFKKMGEQYKNFQTISTQTVELLEQLSFVEENWKKFLFEQRGAELVASLDHMKSNIDVLSQLGGELSGQDALSSGLVPLSPDEYVTLQLHLGRAKKLLDTLIPWLKSPAERHLLVLFGNTSELRPGGGFVGSYADVTIKNASIANVEVHDINDADRTLMLNIVPPKPLQTIAKRWRAADANWFFDYSDSAKKIKEFLEASTLYGDRSETFDGVIEITPQVVGDILELVGPVEVPSLGKTMTKENFLTEIQKEVQAGQSSGAEEPKRVLAELVPAVVQKINDLEMNRAQELFGYAFDWLENKDAAVYFKDPAMESFFDAYNYSGRVYELPEDFNGDYLAVANANIGGGKTDLYMKQNVFFQSFLTVDGTVNNHFEVKRTHRGTGKDKEWWYQVANENYAQVFVSPSVQLSHASGTLLKKIPPFRDAQGDFVEDADIDEVESTAQVVQAYPGLTQFGQYGKTVFATWMRTAAGGTSEFTVDYSHTLYAPPFASSSYQFVFDKQIGSRSNYAFQFNAPLGYRFRENGLPMYEYTTDSPPRRVVFNLTLEKIPQ